MKKGVIYTSIVGNYDPLLEHCYIMEDWDYICFSESKAIVQNHTIWKIIVLPSNEIKNNIRLSRLPKILPHRFLTEYEYSIYLDANINILDDTLEKRVNQLIKKNVKIAIAPHPQRDCVYEEAQVCIKSGKDKKSIIEKQIKEIYTLNNFPTHFGLYQNNLIYRKHNDLVELDQLWWDIYMKYSRRDQLSLVYALWRTGILCENLFEQGFNIRESPKGFSFFRHEVPYTTKKTLYLRKGLRSKLKKWGILPFIHEVKKQFKLRK